tara:strand:- start:288 stop:587 length:300 start_codon:yes stop_codon:yes gene_type:complete
MKNLIAGLFAVFAFCVMCDTTSAQWPWRQPRIVGYQPHVVWLPQGTTLNVNNVYVDPYRRTVTVGINAQFYHVPQVRVFNYHGPQPPVNYNYNYNYWRR